MPFPTAEAAIGLLAEHLDIGPTEPGLTRSARSGHAKVAKYLADGGADLATIPDVIAEEAVIEAGAAVYYRRTARNGIVTLGTGEAIPMRIAKDPLSLVYPILAPYVKPGLA
ncbi:MAG: hypothetical protein ACK5O2_00820 [Microthrixaceae bacterium]